MHSPAAAAEEEESGAQSPEPEAGPVPPPAAPGAWRPQHFACDNPSCGKLLCRPAVLNCGHCVCLPTCLAGSGGPQGSQAAASSAAAQAARYECPACGMAARQLPVVCKQLADLVADLFPAESQLREQEVAAQLAAAAAAAGGSDGSGAAEQPRIPAEQAAVGMEGEEPGTPQASAAQSEGDPTPLPAAAIVERASQQGAQPASGQAEGPQQAQQGAQQQQALSPSLESALRRRQAEGGPASDLAQRLEENLRRLTSGAHYVHHGVGCDACGECRGCGTPAARGCGRHEYRFCRHEYTPATAPTRPWGAVACRRRGECQLSSATASHHLSPAATCPPAGLYPITGRRYRCEDCPEAMGFDLCGDCMDRGVSDIVGRWAWGAGCSSLQMRWRCF